jgi:hypothetical protein
MSAHHVKFTVEVDGKTEVTVHTTFAPDDSGAVVEVRRGAMFSSFRHHMLAQIYAAIMEHEVTKDELVFPVGPEGEKEVPDDLPF